MENENKEPEEKSSSKQNRIYFFMGVITFLLALLGVASIIIFGVKAVKQGKEEQLKEQYITYNRFLIPVAAIDMEPFDDISSASMSELVEVSVWSVLNAGLDPDGLEYKDGRMLLPKASVEEAYRELFGEETELVHCTVEGYGYEFSYDEATGCYAIPITTISPVFTPSIQSVETKGGATVITCGLVNASYWMQNEETGELSSPTPDRYIKVTLRTAGKTQFISAIQLTGAPETASTEASKDGTAPAVENNPAASADTSEETTEEEFTTSDKNKITRYE